MAWYGFGMALVWLWYGFGVVWLWYGFEMALVWLSVGLQLALRWLWGGLGWLCPRSHAPGLARHELRELKELNVLHKLHGFNWLHQFAGHGRRREGGAWRVNLR